MLKLKKSLSLCMLSIVFNSQAALITVASDNAENYSTAWSGNGGFGFEPWHFISDAAGGSAGGFLANKASNPDLNHVASTPSDKSWGSYANGNGFNQFEAYRGFGSNALSSAGDVFNISFEHGDINNGGAVGFVLRNQNININIGDYNQQSLFEFGFIGGGQHYSIWDGFGGQIDTGINFTTEGLNLTLTLLGGVNYQLDIFNSNGNNLLQSRNGTLNGIGSIDSVALYNRDSEFANAYFNNVSVQKAQTQQVPEPSSWLLMMAAMLLLLLNKRSKV